MKKRQVYQERLGLAERLVAERKRRGLRQLDVAREIGVSRVTIARFEIDAQVSDATKAKVRRWLKALPAADEAAAKKARAEGGDGAGEPGFRLPRPRPAVLTRLAVRQRAERAFRIEAKKRAAKRRKGRKGKKRRRRKPPPRRKPW